MRLRWPLPSSGRTASRVAAARGADAGGLLEAGGFGSQLRHRVEVRADEALDFLQPLLQRGEALREVAQQFLVGGGLAVVLFRGSTAR